MEVLDEIVEFLEQNHLKSIVESIKEEKSKPKKPKDSLETIKSTLSKFSNTQVSEENQETLGKFLQKLVKKPLPVQSNPELKKLRAFKKALGEQQQPSPEQQEELPRFGQPETAQVAEDDELFSASQIEPKEPSSIMQHSNASFGALELEEEGEDEYEDDDDTGFYTYDCKKENLSKMSAEIAQKYLEKFSKKTRAPDSKLWLSRDEHSVAETEKQFPKNIRFPNSNDSFYPVEFENCIYDTFNLKVIYDREKTGFEESKDFQIVIGSIIAGRYQVVEYLGSAAFSKAIQCLDLVTKEMVCLKIIENNKDYLDQSIDEIKLLKYIDVNGDVEKFNCLKLIDYFYHKEHLFIVTELLRDNLYEYSKYNREHETEPYFTIGRLQKIAQQVLVALDYLHSLCLVHCDLKPENILIKSYSRCEVKVIDLGSTCFIHDHLGSYVQSRSYRAPEVILGCPYDYKIDIWSLGCILAEMYTGYVLFQSETVQGLLARVIGIVGSLPDYYTKVGRHYKNFLTNDKILYQKTEKEKDFDNRHLSEEMVEIIKKHRSHSKKLQLILPKKSNLKARLHSDDAMFIDFVKCLLEVDKEKRPTAKEALTHPWITECKYEDGIP